MDKKVKIISAGDFAPLRDVIECQKQVKEIWRKFKQADLGIVNLELPLTNSNQKADKLINLKADPTIANSLMETGINMVSIANNHACDFGIEGLMDTIENLNRVNILVFGAGKNIDEAFAPVIQEINGLKIAHIGICSALPTGFAASKDRPGVAPIRAKSRLFIDNVTLDEQPGMSPWVETFVINDDLNIAYNKIKEIKSQVDFLFAQVHWGIPNGWCAQFQGPLADYQQPMAHALIDAGVDLIMGHHPHVVHGVEKYQGGIIVYSLGNFLFHSMSEDHETQLTSKYPPYNVESLETGIAREAVLMETDIDVDRNINVKFYPIVLNKFGEPEFLHGNQAIQVLKRMQKQSADLNTDFFIDGSIGSLK